MPKQDKNTVRLNKEAEKALEEILVNMNALWVHMQKLQVDETFTKLLRATAEQAVEMRRKLTNHEAVTKNQIDQLTKNIDMATKLLTEGGLSVEKKKPVGAVNVMQGNKLLQGQTEALKKSVDKAMLALNQLGGTVINNTRKESQYEKFCRACVENCQGVAKTIKSAFTLPNWFKKTPVTPSVQQQRQRGGMGDLGGQAAREAQMREVYEAQIKANPQDRKGARPGGRKS